jgi:TolB-like protein
VTRSKSLAFVQRTDRLRETWSFIRLRKVGAVALAIVVAVAVGEILVTNRLRGPDAQAELRVAVMPFENRTAEEEFDALGVMAADWVTQALTEAPFLTVLDTRSTLGAARRLGAGVTPMAVGRETGAGLVIAGSYFLQGDSVQFQAQISSTTDGHILFGLGDVMAPRSRPLEAVEQLRQRALAAVASLHDKEVTAFQTRLTHLPTYTAYREYTEGLEQYIRNDGEAARHFERAAVLDTTFLVARLWAVQAWLPPRPGNLIAVDSLLQGLQSLRDYLGSFHRAQLDFLTAQRARDFRDAYGAALRMVETAPGSINARREAALSALRVLRPREALRGLAQLDPERGLIRQWPEYWSPVAWSDHLLGEYDRELVAARRGRALNPSSGLFRFLELRALAALGRTRELDSLVHAELFVIPGQSGILARAIVGELLAHGHLEAAQRLAQYAAEWVAGRPPSEQTAQAWLEQRAALGVFTGESEVLDYFALEHAGARSSFERAKDEWLHERAELALLLGRVDAAGKFVAQLGDPNVHGLLLVRLAAAQGRHDAARAALWGDERRHLARWGSLRGLELDRASALVRIGDVDGALAVLTEGLTRGLIWDSVWGNDGHARPDLAPLWHDRRFQQLIKSRG